MHKPKILLVDDVKLSLEMGKMAFSNAEVDILTACNGREALKAMKTERIDIVLTDLYMPEMNGDELCRCIKSDPSLKHVPVILFSSSFDDESSREKHMKSGCDDILLKPFKKNDLIGSVKKYVNISARENERKAVGIRVDYEVDGKKVSGRIADMSVGGMLIESALVLPKKSELQFSVFIESGGEGVQVLGRVVWSTGEKMGVQFLSSVNRIETFIR